ncbi:HTH domain-containing protein [Epibacterium sp. Ofav1-8]|uniref:HTH domain-containing protein n=1 Tax=Epibacterium sp. Ofav1-8 TaxID=2917735 RepID=UPI001EF6E06C|nr:HTH domain-containing protein [Epibacterium sp. Ofav1-8]MCG7622719.1 HTH domain-containing protein [Epibacterium sp. Ofav1-8]
MARGKGITREEDHVIRLGLQRGRSAGDIANFLGRSRQAIYQRIKRMEETGEIHQLCLDMGQFDE